MELVPIGSLLNVKVAFPPDSAAKPSFVAPFMNVTEPVGLPVEGATAATVAANVTVCPNAEGFGDELSVVLLDATLTVCDRVDEVLVVYIMLPVYVAVMEWPPMSNAEVVKDAFPLLIVPEPIVLAPSLNMTFPLIVPEVGEVTVAVNVTG
jgi:hypothetical protein